MKKRKPKLEKKFSQAQVVINVVGEGPIEFSSLQDLVSQITEGNWIGEYDVKSNKAISSKKAASLAIEMNSEPEFLGIDEKGKDIL